MGEFNTKVNPAKALKAKEHMKIIFIKCLGIEQENFTIDVFGMIKHITHPIKYQDILYSVNTTHDC